MKKTILGIDPGYGTCGFAVLKKNKSEIKLKTFGIIKTAPQSNFADRLHEIANDFESLLNKYKPNLVAIEDLFFVQNITTGIQVAEVRGVLLFLAKKFGCLLSEPKPVEVKNTFTGNGKASKSDMKKMAQLLFNLKKIPQIDDAADAIAVAFFAGQNFDFIVKK